MPRNWKCTIEYDGSRYFGWQRQPDQPTIQQTIEEAATRITGDGVVLTGSGRTDTGVHARGQVANFRTEADRSREALLGGINALIPDDIRILDIEAVSEDFHARFDARSKRYVYRVYEGPTPPVFERHFCMHHRLPLDLERMRDAAERLLGRHDFRAFARKPPPHRNTVRSLTALDIWRRGATMMFSLEADGFLHTMVRSIVGTLLQVGNGKREPRDLETVLSSRDRTLSGPPAPPQGLFLMEVSYGTESVS